MNFRLNHFERAAIAFMVVAALGIVVSLSGLATRNGWFERKMTFSTTLDTSEGIREGSPIEMSGVRIGSVTAVDIDNDNRVRLKLAIRKRFASRLHTDCHLEIFHPFVIGDKSIAVYPGTADQPLVADRSEIRSVEVPSLAELLDGRKLVPYFKTFNDSLDALKSVADILVRDNHPAEFAKALNRLPALLASADQMSSQVGRLASQLGRSADFGKDIGSLVTNLATLTNELNKLAPEFPKSSQRVGEALDEAIVVLKAMQKTFLLSSSVRDVRREQAEQRSEDAQRRTPSSSDRLPEK